MSSPIDINPYYEHRAWLLQHARTSMIHGVKHGHPPLIELDPVPALLKEKRATFITLEKRGSLRGCIGRLDAVEPLVIDIAQNAVAAAIDDHRFPPVSEGEIPGIRISISILTPPEPMSVDSEAELIANLQPGVDGLILQDGRRRATFLPSVWEELPITADFIRHLKVKAGLPPDYWSVSMKAFRYQTIYLKE